MLRLKTQILSLRVNIISILLVFRLSYRSTEYFVWILLAEWSDLMAFLYLIRLVFHHHHRGRCARKIVLSLDHRSILIAHRRIVSIRIPTENILRFLYIFLGVCLMDEVCLTSDNCSEAISESNDMAKSSCCR